ncbi:uncharacterized protein K460DRAFT_269538 [Cucurbitaria berberidis CBS 394.84]|uniref:Uncharacterized protein n=1 Tax=Cucurbitaria berberidis CBS 394.84 TaxID=1168544 RepID=A0A9P4GRL3_9PLEO|nr:uncharacterized protein K460DRAFT_269538 [Cucurbitaria berberidis CBS 394.84]KAF1850244.1 hypothetical protein K460DRAFT_269538 [Cucurbitaria berberidis CBS 394.84]
MRYSSAVVISTLAVGQAAASNMHNRHASFHARRQADTKRGAEAEIAWDKIAYDLKDVNWEKVNWSSVFNTPTPTPVVAPTPTPEQKKPEYKAPEVKKPEPTTTKEAAKPTPEAKKEEAPTSTSAKAPEPSVKKESIKGSIKDTLSDVVSDVLNGVAGIAGKVGAKIGKNDKSNNGGIWIGDDSDWQAEFTNDASKNAVLYCWKANGFSGMSVNVNVPEVSVGLKPGEKVTLSFAPNVPAACAPAFIDTSLAIFGGWDQTWFEVTFGQFGAFDISRNVNMNGCNISSKGSKCTSDMNTCVFKCKDSSVKSCEKGADYDLFNCGASSGGGGGYDTVMAGTGGGCAMGSSGEKISVNFS